LTWKELVARWKQLGEDQYLADVEAYEVNGQWRYAALWRVGRGTSGLLLTTQDKLVKAWRKGRKQHELLDLEVIKTKRGLRYLGVWRRKQAGQTGTEGLWIGLTWDQLRAKHAELRDSHQFADIETYVSGGKRRFAAVWHPGKSRGAFYLLHDWAEFAAKKRELNKDYALIDFEMFQSNNGTWSFLGVWRMSDRAGPLHASTSSTAFEPLSRDELLDRWRQLRSTRTLTDIEVAIPGPTPLAALRGDTTCKYGDPDCNRCAPDVPGQFERAFRSDWRAGSWTFRGNDRYPPDRMTPVQAFKGAASKHIQGLVRTNSSRFPYAGSHSHKRAGSIFVVEDRSGDLVLHSLYKSPHHHPSGVAVLGDSLFVAERGMLRRFSISEAGSKQNRRYEVATRKQGDKGLEGAGGGLGLAKLYDGTTLLIVSAPGGGFRPGIRKKARNENRRPRYTRFYRLFPHAYGNEPEVLFIGAWPHEGESARPKSSRAYSENLSVLTECGTGRIYTVHTTGSYRLRGKGFWRLARAELGPNGPRLVHVATKSQPQRAERCHHRSSATVRVNASGKLELLCTERRVIKLRPTGKFSFRRGSS
jgi:hypothetical protein